MDSVSIDDRLELARQAFLDLSTGGKLISKEDKIYDLVDRDRLDALGRALFPDWDDQR